MPRDGSGNYTQPFPIVVEGTTIESVVYNGFTTDVAQDLNTPRPIVAGGTGADNAHDAMIALGGELAGQHVTNYDSHVFVDGSFFSAPGAAGAPDATNYFVGICYGAAGTGSPILEARAATAPDRPLYTRLKLSGTWSAWESNLKITKADPAIVLSKTASGQAATVYGQVNTAPRWALILGDGLAESATSTGSDFRIQRYDNAGAYIDTPLRVDRVIGDAYFSSTVSAPSFWAGITTGYYYFGNSGTRRLEFNGSRFNAVGGDFHVADGNVMAVGHLGRAGTAGGFGVSSYNFNWNSSVLDAWVDTVHLGAVSVVSDYRIKKDVTDLPGMWDTVKALRPIQYTQAEFQPPAQKAYLAKEAIKARVEAEQNPEAKPREVATGPMFVADDVERWGFIAHELQATLTPSAATGEKDSPNTIQSPNPFTLIAALTKALQEAMVRIEALEAG